MDRLKGYSLPMRVKIVTGGLCAFLGLLVITGWHTRNPDLLRISPSFGVMQYNSALGFAICGFALISLAYGWRRSGIVLAAVVIIIGSSALLEQTLNLNFGIGQLFIEDYITPMATHPGRMTSDNAICLVLGGFALILMGLSKEHKPRFLIAGIPGAGIAVVGLVAFYGYLIGPLAGLGNGYLTGMAFHGAMGFLCLGIGITAITWMEGRQSKGDSLQWIPLLVGAGTMTVVLCVWRLLSLQENLMIGQAIRSEMMSVNNQIRLQMDARIRPLARIAERWKASAVPRDTEWKSDASSYINEFNACEAVEWVLPSLQVEGVVSRHGYGNLLNRSRPPEVAASLKSAMETARQSRMATASHAFDFGDGQKGFLICAPIFQNNECRGFLVGVFHSQALFAGLLENIAPSYSIAVFDRQSEIYGRYDARKETQGEWGQQREIKVLGTSWRVHVWPTLMTLRGMKSIIPGLTLFTGTMVALLITISLYLAGRARMDERKLTVVNQLLEEEVQVRKEAEKVLRIREERYRILVDGVKDYAIFMLDPGGQVISWNVGASRLMGYDEKEILGKRHSIFYPPEVVESGKPFELLKRAAAGGACEDQGWCFRKDGSKFWADARITALYEDGGKIRGFAKITHDITEHKEIADQLEHHRQELIRSNTELEQFAYVASHDLQEPLRMVSSYAQLLSKRYKAKLDAEADEFIGYLVGGVERMNNLIRDLLAFSRVGRKIRIEKFSCEKIMDLVLANLEVAIEESGATVTRDFLPEVASDPTQLLQLFQNLIGNAIKFHGEQPPHIHVSATRRDGPEWMLSVRDNGLGIDPKFNERIFVIFQRLHSREAYPGTGIGLAVCKKIVESCGGRIWVESALGKGSTFFFTLPVPNDPS